MPYLAERYNGTGMFDGSVIPIDLGVHPCSACLPFDHEVEKIGSNDTVTNRVGLLTDRVDPQICGFSPKSGCPVPIKQ